MSCGLQFSTGCWWRRAFYASDDPVSKSRSPVSISSRPRI
ncbi:hypothetical protein GFS60_01608 [Rhodococcus sp. WAY2]|nr:hypothetical protein GFS60_01608 [Rhodococcus sp. WAY2]